VTPQENLFFWRADGHEQQVGPAGADLLDHFGLFLLAVPVTVAPAGDQQVRILAQIGVTHRQYHVLARAEQEHAPAPVGGALHQRLEQVDPGHSFLQRRAQQARRPHHRHAVGVDQRAIVNDAAQRLVAAGLDQLVDINHHVLVRLAGLDEALYFHEGVFH
jgi:hypothetical protein